MNTGRDPTSRLRANLNPLRTTALGNGFHGPNTTPLSAVSMNQTPASAIQPYNPQQWAPSPAPERHHYQEQPQSPPPPPPYSPPRSQRPSSMVFETSPANISAARAPLPGTPNNHHLQQGHQRPSPESTTSQTSFAPPPGTTRGASRERRFGLPSFGRRRDSDQYQQQNITLSPSDTYTHTHAHQPIPPPPASRSPQPPLQHQPQQQQQQQQQQHQRSQPPLQPLQTSNYHQQHQQSQQPPAVAPGSRRAASAGAIATPTSARSRSSSQVRWEAGMPLPPPPPGPPPSGSRSQSMTRPHHGSDPIVSGPTRRPPPAGVAVLGPVPPTPAGWFDRDLVEPENENTAVRDGDVDNYNDPYNDNATPRQVPDSVAAAAAAASAAAAREDHSPNRGSLVESTSSAASSSARDLAESAPSTNSTHSSHSPSATVTNGTNSSSGGSGSSNYNNMTLARTGAVRGGEKTLRERRNESRNRGANSVRNSIDGAVNAGINADSSSGPGHGHARQLSNIVIPAAGSVGSLMRRPTINKSTPRSGGGGPNSGRALLSLQQQQASPRSSDTVTGGTATPPFSPYPHSSSPNMNRPHMGSIASGLANDANANAVPKALPTPPLRSRASSASSQTRRQSQSPPNTSDATTGAGSGDTLTRELAVSQSSDQFCQGSVDRFHAFAQREAAAGSDAERVRLFAEFMVAESRVRRERYAAAIGAMGSEIFDLTRDFFRPMLPAVATAPFTAGGGGRREPVASQGSADDSAGTSAVEFTPQSSEPSHSHRGSVASVFREGSASAPLVGRDTASSPDDNANFDSAIDSSSTPNSAHLPMSPSGPPPGWGAQANYMPSLSPILSMSVSEHPDDKSSRGRTASRWWESSENGGEGRDGRGGRRDDSGDRLARSKRESKYMGVPKEAREALQWTDDLHEPLSGRSVRSPQYVDPGVGSSGNGGPVNYAAYEGSSEYPPEKVHHHPQADYMASPDPVRTPQAPPAHFRNSYLSSTASSSTPGLSTPNTPNAGSAFQQPGAQPLHQNSIPAALDVSRLVTLPPPYPRHHPAVNNNHPDLSETRAAVRTLASLGDVEAAYDQCKRATEAAHIESDRAQQQQTATMRASLQEEIASGRMSYAEAAAIEADAAAANEARQKESLKADFDRFQTMVVQPVNELLTGRIAHATQLFDELRSRLFGETRQPSPNLPQEEGDEQPELLETLTLLKWVFEAREALHRAIYDLLTERNNRYRDMVLAPYRRAGDTAADKLRDAEAFFAGDAATRAAAFAAEALQRTEAFRDVVEANVVRGVEVQLSAFWDIAPPLAQLLDQVPLDLTGFTVQIPAAEYEETPSYHEHPLQYLFSLLLHAEKSTHQFIESQTNLLCLLHEVKEAALTAKDRTTGTGEANSSSGATSRDVESARLTDDLKDKVRVVQGQWRAGLGETFELVKERVGGWLLETGGWDESLEDGGVGGV
ncbi:hypothetical protein HMPREF1624_03594 [Sporothrix schenckii ATCC 58251]|uniref:Uncharacterized protein n=1 Tax=Sporothrix schenckii (strain ATCC 58251 / de Perez 2211183) TaxID=1391915 RepID=U7PXA1_SPOS1|nr:hypothetical protein HMPREF1624_03594 [Sporothrix schenckii ATCC 58251]